MTPTFGAAMSGGPFPGVAIQRESGNRPPAMLPPDRDLNQLQHEIEQIFEHAYNESQQSSLLARVNRGWDMVPSAAAMNIEDQGSNYVVTVALPGYDKQGIAISLEGRLLIIEAAQPSRAPAAATRNAPIARRGQFHTQIMMPDNIEGGGAQAVYDHDVLHVHIPKAAQTNSLVRSITIR
jgi:HSP20 family protein